MPVFSYIAYPETGAKEELIKDLSSMDFCEVMPADNRDILILLTDTPNDEKERALQAKLKGLTSLQSLGMTFGHADE